MSYESEIEKVRPATSRSLRALTKETHLMNSVCAHALFRVRQPLAEVVVHVFAVAGLAEGLCSRHADLVVPIRPHESRQLLRQIL